MRLGIIADDFTGGTDVANVLAREGLRVVQAIGVPPASRDFGDVDVLVIAPSCDRIRRPKRSRSR